MMHTTFEEQEDTGPEKELDGFRFVSSVTNLVPDVRQVHVEVKTLTNYQKDQCEPYYKQTLGTWFGSLDSFRSSGCL